MTFQKPELVIIKEQEHEFYSFLTEKCKEDFRKWFLLSNYREQFGMSANIPVGHSILEAFNLLPLSMQYGVYVDFFDSVDTDINIICALEKCNNSTRHDARVETLKISNHNHNNL